MFSYKLFNFSDSLNTLGNVSLQIALLAFWRTKKDKEICFKIVFCLQVDPLSFRHYYIIMTLIKGLNSTKGDTPDFKKTYQSFLMRNPYMKFQNCVLKIFEGTHGRADRWMIQKQYAPSTFPKLGHKKLIKLSLNFSY